MSYFKKIISLMSVFFLLSACSSKESPSTIKIGVIAGPETTLMQTAKEIAAKKYGLDIVVVPFNDYALPNEALADGSIDANMFQHLPYLNETLRAKDYKLVVIGKMFIYPMGIYSAKIKHLNELRNGAIVGIPNDPSNEARALLLLEKAGLVSLRPDSNSEATIDDIIKNPKKLLFKTLDAAQLPRVLPDVDIAAINTNYAMDAGLLPSRDALFIEGAESIYANVVVVRAQDANDPRFKKLMNVLHSKAMIQEAQELFKNQAIAAW